MFGVGALVVVAAEAGFGEIKDDELLLAAAAAAGELRTGAGDEVRLLGSNGGGPICCSCWIMVLSMAASGLRSSVSFENDDDD